MSKLDYLFESINVVPKNKELYLSALTHPSCNANGRCKHQDYDRLEFMGDAVLGYVTADLAFKLHPEMEEGKLTKLRSNIVQRSSLANYARSIQLENYIHANKSFTVDSLRESDKILEDVFEALIGAIYMDLGLKKAYKHVERFVYDDIKDGSLAEVIDYKTKLQEAFQAEHREAIQYVLVNKTGSDNDPTFTIKAMYTNICLGVGIGHSKKFAEQAAAKDALSKMGK